jgi:hypothetical protein
LAGNKGDIMVNPSAALTAIKISVRGKVKPVSFDQKALTGDVEVSH